MRKKLSLLLATGLLVAPLLPAQAFDIEQALRELAPQYDAANEPDLQVTQNNGKTLSQAIDEVRRKTKGRIVGAETRISGNREVHHIKVLTKDGKVKTHKVQGRKLGNR